MNMQPVPEGKMQGSHFLRIAGFDTQFVHHLANCRRDRRFAILQFPARPVDFPGPQPAFLVNRQHLAVTNHKQQVGPQIGDPVFPIRV